MMQRVLGKNINRTFYIAILAGLVLARLLIAYSQRVFLMPELAALDDELMLNAARSVVDGGWLGAYGAFTIAKNMGFALWLAACHVLHLPLLLANAALWVAASAFAVRALRPLLRGNVGRLLLFAFFAFQPIAFAPFNLRTYRDSIFPAFCLLFFAGVVGLALRAAQPRLRGSLLFSLGAGAGLCGAWLLREDGVALLPFAICGLAAVFLFLLFGKEVRRKLAKSLLALLPFCILLTGIWGYSGVNQLVYGVFLVNDLTGGSFPAAYGAVVAVSEGEAGYVAGVPATQGALQKMYAEVPSLALLQESLSGGGAYNGFSNRETGEFGGSFYYALKLAADYAGVTPDAQTAQRFWEGMEGEIAQAVREGRLRSVTPSASTLPRWHNSLLVPTAKETLWGALKLLTFEDSDPRPAESLGDPALADEMAAFVRSPLQRGYVEGTDQPYFNPVQRVAFVLCDVLIWLYCVLIWPLLALAVVQTLRGLWIGGARLFRRQGFSPVLLFSVLSLGLLLSALLRLVIAAYMEVASFGVGTYLMYLSGAMPPLLLACGMGCVLPLPKGEWRRVHAMKRSIFPQTLGGGRDVTRLWLVLFGVGLLVLQVLLCSGQRVYLHPVESGLDDGMMLEAAQAIVKGDWLGAYGWLTLSKHTFFALWLAVLHVLHIPYLLGNHILWAAACAVLAWAVFPVLKKRLLGLLLYAVLLFAPSAIANPAPYGYALRVYRDGIFPALCMLCVAGMIGFALRREEQLKRTAGWLVLGGLGLAACWLTREDGWWLLPFVVVSVIVTLVFMWRAKGTHLLRRSVALLLPFAVLAVGLSAWAGMNYAYYGRFIISDFSSGEFADAYGALTRVEHENWDPKTAVPKDVREKLYARVPAFAALRPALESTRFIEKYGNHMSGSFYWALREAGAGAGYYATPEKAKAYFESLANSVNALVNSGELAGSGRRSGVNPPIRAAYIKPVLAEGLRSLVYCASFEDCDPHPLRSQGEPETQLAPLEQFLGERVASDSVQGGDALYFNPMQRFFFRVLEILRQGYAVALPFALAAALVWQGRAGVALLKRLRKKQRAPDEALLFWIQLGVLFCILLRVFMVAFASVSSFGIGTYIAYLASVHPLMILYGFMGTLELGREILRRKQKRTHA